MAGTTETTQESLDEWRTTEFEEMGFEKTAAVELAVGRDQEGWPIGVHTTRQLLAQGCTHDQALRILL